MKEFYSAKEQLATDLSNLDGRQAKQIVDTIVEIQKSNDSIIINKVLETLSVSVLIELGKNVIRCIDD